LFSFCPDLSKQHQQTVVNAKLLQRQWLSETDKNNILVRLLIQNGKRRNIGYQPGDHAVVFPVNTDDDVDLVMQRMCKLPADPHSVVQLHEYNQQEGL
jgi:sulfite reductase alpha subunit-like flavoprotein